MSTPEPNKKRDYSRYDQMSTSELEQLLRLDFQAAEGGDSDLDAILYISDLLAKRNSPADTDAAWEQFETKYRPYAHGRSLYDLDDGQAPQPQPAAPPAPPRFRPVRRLRRMALLAAALIACLLGAMAVAQAAGVDVLGAIARWTDETFVFVPAASGPPSGTSFDEEELAQLHASLQPLDMEGRFPTWYPEGFVPGELEVTELHSSVSAHIVFLGEDCVYTVVVQHYTQPQTNTGVFEKDDTPVEQYVHNGQTFYILSNLDSLTATTYDGEFMTMICGSLTREEIKAIIDSIPAPSSSLEPEQLRERLAQEGQSLYFPQIPEGFEPTQSQYYVDPITEELFWSQLYQRGEEFLIFGVTKHAGAPDNIYEKDDTPVEQYVYHQVSHYIFSNNGSTTAAWMVGDTEYYMFASDGAVDMKALIRSAYEAV